MTGAVVEVRVNARIDLVGEVGAVRTGVGGLGVGVVGTARGHAAGGTVLAAVTVDAGVGLVGEVGVVRASSGCAGAVATSSSVVGSGASASSGGETGVVASASAGGAGGTGASSGIPSASCGVSGAVVYGCQLSGM